jgi:heme/copper-type cytochrome/quinol oxidase subunit 1
MGAVFGLMGGTFYWIYKMTGATYNEKLGQLTFWIIFAGVNITFFPMHFLGLAGMPRRIPDYPDEFAGWNNVASIGSMVTVLGIMLLFYVLMTLNGGKKNN